MNALVIVLAILWVLVFGVVLTGIAAANPRVEAVLVFLLPEAGDQR